MERAAADLSEEDDEDESGGGARSVRVSRRLQRRRLLQDSSSLFLLSDRWRGRSSRPRLLPRPLTSARTPTRRRR